MFRAFPKALIILLLQPRLLLGALAALSLPAWPAETPADTARSENPYPEAPPFTVAPPRVSPKYYPCSRCHEHMDVDLTIRPLKAPHPKLHHGQARMWCYNCHNPSDQDTLRTLLDEAVAFTDGHIICAQCHATQARDWYFGAHGKRVGNWEGSRELYSCSACHDPHSPARKPRRAEPPPAVRAGLERQDGHALEVKPLWEHTIQRLLEDIDAQR